MSTKKIAPPGRRGTVKKISFKSEEEEEIVQIPPVSSVDSTQKFTSSTSFGNEKVEPIVVKTEEKKKSPLTFDDDDDFAAEIARLKAEESAKVAAQAKIREEAEQARLNSIKEAEIARIRAENEARVKDEARLRAEAEAAREKAEAEAIAAAEAKAREEVKKMAEIEAARIKAIEEKRRAEEETRARAEEEARARAEEEARARAEEEARARAEEEARARAEEEARARARAEEEARARAEEEARIKIEEERLRIEALAEEQTRAERQRLREEAKRERELKEKELEEQEKLFNESNKEFSKNYQKRLDFLSNIDNFSVQFNEKTQLDIIKASETKTLEADEIMERLKRIDEKSEKSYDLNIPDLPPAPLPSVYVSSSTSPVASSTTSIKSSNLDDLLAPSLNDNKKDIFKSSSLFSTSEPRTFEPLVLPSNKNEEESSLIQPTEELRMPTRIGKQKKEKEKESNNDSLPIFSPEALKLLNEEEDKQIWKAKQSNLNKHTKDFHGVVTLMFDGIFSWQMYGSAEAIDETGSSYTEYLMRCQWGTSFSNLQPWIVAHRYREFDRLDQELKKKFPEVASIMPKLPKKELFGSLDPNVVTKRRQAIEEYMCKVIMSMPNLLNSELMNRFLRIKERIKYIKKLIDTKEQEEQAKSNPTSSGESSPIPAPSTLTCNFNYNNEEDEEENVFIWTSEQADSIRNEKSVSVLTQNELQDLENNINLIKLSFFSNTNEAIVNYNEIYHILLSLTKKWPALRATSEVGGNNTSFLLIPKALQVEEDLIALINEFKNLKALVAAQNY